MPTIQTYYPDEDTCKRLWGHINVVGGGPGRKQLLVKLDQKPLPLELDHLGVSVRTVFLSHALGDHHFAARVRLNFARHEIGSWLAEGDLHEKDGSLFEAVEASLYRCDALVMLVSSISISSAWVLTEAQTALQAGKRVFALVDASDVPICKFLWGWTQAKKESAWLESNEGIQALSDVLERYMRVAPPKTRVLKFRSGVQSGALVMMASCVAVYPDVPLEWEDREDMTRWIGFESLLHQLTTQNGSRSSVLA